MPSSPAPAPSPAPSALKIVRCEIHKLHHDHGSKFIPHDRLEEVLSRERVKDILEEISPKCGNGHIQPNFHLDPEERVDHIVNNCRIVLAILVHLSLEELILRLLWCCDFTDASLPITAEDLKTVDSELEKTGFLRTQYQFVPGRLKQGTRWRESVVTPFLEDEEIGEGGFSTVYKIRVYPFYDHIPNEKLWAELASTGGPLYEPHRYVRKELLVTGADGTTFELEAFANKLLRAKHPGLSPLLAWYWHGSSCNLVFPLADGDLQDYYRMKSNPSSREEVLQFLESISKLAEALVVIHDGVETPDPDISLHGYHWDLKPKNILFKEDKTGRRHFMISDFGLTRFKQATRDRTSTGLRFEYGSSTYRAPECGVGANVTRAADVWSLGCIFAEALTFAFRGQDGVQEFMVSRKQNVHTPQRDLFHTGVRAGVKPEIKPEVVSWLDNLAQDGEVFASQFVGVLKKMLSAEPTERPKIDTVVQLLQVLIADERRQLQLPPIQIRAVTQVATETESKGQARVTTTTATTKIIAEDHRPPASVRKSNNTRMGNFFNGIWSSFSLLPGRIVGVGLGFQTRTPEDPPASCFLQPSLSVSTLSISYESVNGKLLQGSQGSSVPRTIPHSVEMSPKTSSPAPALEPDPNGSASATPQLKQTDNPLGTLQRYDTMFVIDCREKFSPPSDPNSVRSRIATSLERFVKTAIEYDNDGLDLAFIHEQYPEGRQTVYRKLKNVNAFTQKYYDACQQYDAFKDYHARFQLSSCLDNLLSEYQKRMKEGLNPKPLNMIVLIGSVTEWDDFKEMVLEYAKNFDDESWRKRQVGLQFVLVGEDSSGSTYQALKHLDNEAYKEQKVRDMVDTTQYDPAADAGNTEKLYKILCGGVNRIFDNYDDNHNRKGSFCSTASSDGTLPFSRSTVRASSQNGHNRI